MNERFKGFIFGAFLMLITPALALQQEPHDMVDELTRETTELGSVEAPYFRLTFDDAEGAISQALSERGAGAKINAKINNQAGDDFLFSHSQPINVEIRGLRFDAANQRFSANLVSLAEGKVLSARAVSGRYLEMIEVPVLKRSVRAGEVIQASDLEFRDYAKARARSDTLVDLASLVGKSPERVISAGRPVRSVELAQPSVIKKNDIVKMLYSERGMEISTHGQAMSDGVHGSVISLRNTESKKIVQGTVVDKNTVNIVGGGALQAQAVRPGEVYEN